MAAYADQVAKAMDRAGLEQAILVGHSNGVVVAREFARRHPQRLRGMVTLDGALQSIFDQASIDQICSLLYGEQRAQFLASMQAHSQPNTSEAELERIHSGHITTRAGVQVASFRAAADLSIWQEDVPLAVPLLAVHAEQAAWNESYQTAVRSLGSDVELVIWSDVGHHIQWERTDELHALMEAWLDARGL
jgi:pimeloyl-ACP methyl ester carboxylesterase